VTDANENFTARLVEQGLRFCSATHDSEDIAHLSVADKVRGILEISRDNHTRDGLLETPERFARAFLDEWTRGYEDDAEEILKTFAAPESYDEMVVVTGVPIYSLCEHHLTPFFGRAHVAYIPRDRVVGLSKIARLVDAHARRLQIQERITQDVCDDMERVLAPRGVAVQLRCRHLCMESRGARVPGTVTVTTALHGVLKSSDAARAEFLSRLEDGT